MKISRSFVVVTALLVVFSLLLTACTAPAPAPSAPAARRKTQTEAPKKEKFLIGMSQANKGEPWRQAMNDQIAAAAAQYPEFEVVFADAAQNNTKQVADVENFIQQGIDLLIISPNEAAPLTDVVAKAYDKGIPVIVLDRKVNGDKYTMWIGADNVLIGQKAGEFIAKWCKDKSLAPCNVMEIRGLEGPPRPRSAATASARASPATRMWRSSPARMRIGCVRRPFLCRRPCSRPTRTSTSSTPTTIPWARRPSSRRRTPSSI